MSWVYTSFPSPSPPPTDLTTISHKGSREVLAWVPTWQPGAWIQKDGPQRVQNNAPCCSVLATCQREGLVALVSPLSGSGKWDPGPWGRASQMCAWHSGLCQAQAALLRPRALGQPPIIGEEKVGSEPQGQLSTAIRGLCGASAGEDSVGERGSEAWPEWLVPRSHVTPAGGPDGNPPASEAWLRAFPGESPAPTLALSCPGSGPQEGAGLPCSARVPGRGSLAGLQPQGELQRAESLGTLSAR